MSEDRRRRKVGKGERGACSNITSAFVIEELASVTTCINISEVHVYIVIHEVYWGHVTYMYM